MAEAEGKAGLHVYNTLTRKKEPFRPVSPPHVGMYVCGLTAYDYMHVGHARTAVAFETIRRWLVHRGHDVTFVQNVTDVDDKIIDRARELKVDPQAHAAKWAEICNDDVARLGVPPPDVQPKVTEHIPHIVRLIERLVERGYAYRAPDGSVYYRVAKKPDYGKLSNRSPDEMLAGARVEPAEGKEDPKDFALWKAFKPGEPAWDSPWGKGRPGWHIECSAMALAYLGESFDIHGGGVDLVFPHHENEVAQSEGATGKPFVKYWLHTGFLTVNGEKMSKSLKNFVTVQDLLRERDPEAVRFLYANTHYRSGIDYSPTAIEEAAAGLERLRRVREELYRPPLAPLAYFDPVVIDGNLIKAANALREDFVAAMDDDFNTRAAVAAMFDFATAANRIFSVASPSVGARQYARFIFERLGKIITIFDKPATATSRREISSSARIVAQAELEGLPPPLLPGLLDLILRERELARSKKNFAASDRIRQELLALGVEIEDTKSGAPRWRVRT